MSDKDPFAEPDDNERTVIKPNPGGRRGLAQPSPHPAAGQGRPQFAPPVQPAPSDPGGAMGIPTGPAPGGGSEPSAEAGVEQGLTGMNKINASAATLFSLVGRIRNRAQHMDPEKLRQSVLAEVRAFENRALKAGVDAQDVKIARYAICATLDDVVLNTPWGGQSSWARQSMVGTFHKETVGGDRFFDLLARLEKEPGKNIGLLEFLYMCLALGFEGRLRVEQGGSEKHLQIRNGLARIIRGQRGDTEKDLSPRWKGLDLPHKVRSIWLPVWITAGTVAAVLTAAFLTFSGLLNKQTENILGQLTVLESDQVAEMLRRAPPPPPPPPPSVEQIERVKGFLEDEIAQGLVEVFQSATAITVRIAGSGMFGSGSDQVKAAYQEPLERVADAVNKEAGAIIIVGHSDNVPIRSSRFPSNMALSLARAEAVMKSLSAAIDDPARMSAEGRADKEPIASNGTREGRAKNRRIEVVLMKEENI